MIGQTLALKSADRLISLTLSSTMSELPAGAASVWDERIAMAKAKGMAGLVPATIERWFSEDFCLEHGEQVEPIRELMQATSIDGFAGCCRAISRLDLTGLLPALKTPTLVIVGEHDPGTPVSAAERIQQNIPGSELVVIDGALHLCNVEKPEVFNAALTAFLAKH
jgi:3-oxoadipate enol-lactonase